MQHTEDTVEIEIKLRLSPGSRVVVERRPAFNPPDATTPHIQHEVTTYFGAPNLALSRRGATLRVRHGGRYREQTLKVSGGGQEPLKRGEWNCPAKKPPFHTMDVSDAPLPKMR